ncbi:hypothetical protein B0H19DRAFT_520703 [Mycena capillaripes]|nr:hypothetical protein B0H19DRAFT_520703 [Mycena capillaripes]
MKQTLVFFSPRLQYHQHSCYAPRGAGFNLPGMVSLRLRISFISGVVSHRKYNAKPIGTSRTFIENINNASEFDSACKFAATEDRRQAPCNNACVIRRRARHREHRATLKIPTQGVVLLGDFSDLDEGAFAPPCFANAYVMNSPDGDGPIITALSTWCGRAAKDIASAHGGFTVAYLQFPSPLLARESPFPAIGPNATRHVFTVSYHKFDTLLLRHTQRHRSAIMAPLPAPSPDRLCVDA